VRTARPRAGRLFAALLVLLAGTPAQAAQDEATRLLESRHLSGEVFAEDVRTGAEVAAASVGEGADARPLSAAKLFLAASFFEHENALPPPERPDVDLLIAHGSDDAGRKLALALRRRLGSAVVLRDLARFGFPRCRALHGDCTTLSAATSDKDWADALSLGEFDFRATPQGLSHFLRMIGRDGLGQDGRRRMRAATATRLHKAMLATVAFGTASGARDRLGNGARLGRKTGTTGSEPHDGLFAGLVFDADGQARFTIVTYVRRGGFGGGAAAEISSDVARSLLNPGGGALPRS
jgi:hypothetical protein